MMEREVTEYETETLIRNPDRCEPSVKERMNAFKFMNGRYLRATYKDEPDYILVITVTMRKKPFKEW